MLEKSHFLLRVKVIPIINWQAALGYLSEGSKAQTYLVDSCPISVCHLKRARSNRLYSDERKAYSGYHVSKAERFYGLKVHLVTDVSGCPVDIVILLNGQEECSALPPAVGAVNSRTH